MPPRLILALFVVLILYGSFYPFRFDLRRFAEAWDAGLFRSIPFRYSGPGDTIANLIAYIPIGIFLRLSLQHLAGMRGFVATVAGGMALSLCVEIAQFATVTRSPNYSDLLLNTISTAAGALIAQVIWIRLGSVLAVARHSGAPMLAWLLLLLWIGIHAAPFVPSLGMHKLRAALSPLRDFPWTPEGVARWFAAWLILAAIVQSLTARKWFVRAFAVTAIVSLCMRLTFTGHALSLNEVLGLLVAGPIAILLPVLAAPGALAGLLISGFAPFHLQNEPSPVGWVPFVGFLESDLGKVYPVVMEKAYLYAGSVWLLYRAGLGRVTSGVIVAAVLAVVEVTQRYLPGRSPEVADPLIALLVIMLLEKKKGNRR